MVVDNAGTGTKSGEGGEDCDTSNGVSSFRSSTLGYKQTQHTAQALHSAQQTAHQAIRQNDNRQLATRVADGATSLVV